MRSAGCAINDYSLLAREINWMETGVHPKTIYTAVFSLLAREINWMETSFLECH